MQDRYKPEDIQSRKQLGNVYRTLKKEMDKLLSALQLKQEELMANSTNTALKLATPFGAETSSWAIPKAKAGDIREPGATQNLEAMREEATRFASIIESLAQNITIQYNSLTKMTEINDNDAFTLEEKTKGLLAEANNCAKAIQEFKEIYATAWGITELRELEEKSKLSPEKPETPAEREAEKMRIAVEANRKLKEWESSPEASALEKKKQEEIQQKQEFAKAFAAQESSRLRRTTSQIEFEKKQRQTLAKLKVPVESEANILHAFRKQIQDYKNSKSLFGNRPEFVTNAARIDNYFEANKPTTITDKLLDYLKTQNPQKNDPLSKIINDFTTKAQGYYVEPAEPVGKRTL